MMSDPNCFSSPMTCFLAAAVSVPTAISPLLTSVPGIRFSVGVIPFTLNLVTFSASIGPSRVAFPDSPPLPYSGGQLFRRFLRDYTNIADYW